MALVKIKINGVDHEVESGLTILQAAHNIGIDIPTLCYLKDVNEIGACRVCVVEVKGARSLVTSCVYPVADGMEIVTNSPRVLEARKTNLELLLSNHNQDCLGCVRSQNCELQKLSKDYSVSDTKRFVGDMPEAIFDDSAAHMYRDNSKCILCRRCVAACGKVQNIGVIGANERGFNTHIGCAFESDLAGSTCISCGQCIIVCPTGALSERDSTHEVMDAINNPDLHVICQTAPSIRATLGEAFGMPIGTNVEGKMAAAVRRLGFDAVFDTDFGADLTIMEEANEFVQRVKTGGKLPMITSCSPGWVKYCETFHPDFIPNLSTCKSPQQMFGAISKSYYAEKMGIPPEKICVVSIMPCVAKKFEKGRKNQNANGVADVDIVITSRELARMITRAGINFVNLPDEKFDPALGDSTGAGVIFGATGGVMEAALRTAVETLTGDELQKLDFTDVRGTKGIKEAEYDVNGMKVRVCVVSGLANANTVLNNVRDGKANYHFIEVMACPGGCINGGGQPLQPALVRNNVDLQALRAKALYKIDANMTVRKSHESPLIKKLYAEFLGEPGGHKAHHLLHTSFEERERNF